MSGTIPVVHLYAFEITAAYFV